MDKKKKEWKIVGTKQFEEDMKRLSPEEREKAEEAIKKIAQNPYAGEPSKPCPKCGKYFFHSDETCPFCGFKIERS